VAFERRRHDQICYQREQESLKEKTGGGNTKKSSRKDLIKKSHNERDSQTALNDWLKAGRKPLQGVGLLMNVETSLLRV